MEKRFIKFSPPDITEAEINEVAEALRSGWITTGPRTKLLERRLAAYIETGRNDIDVDYKVPSTDGYSLKTCKEALEVPPIPNDATNNELTKQSKQVVERLKYIKPGENAFTADLPAELQIQTKTKMN